MKQEDVVALASLLNSTAEDVSQSVENGTVSELINGFLGQVKIMPEKDFVTFQENLKAQAIKELDKNKLPREIYEYVKGAVLEKTEKQLAQEYGIQSYNGMNDLVGAIIKTKAMTTPDEEAKKLKDRIMELENNHKIELDSVSKTFQQRFIDAELNRVISELPIDAEGSKLDNQQEIVRAMVKAKINFNIENDRIVAEKDGRLMTDTKLDPIPVKDVVYQFAKDYVNLRPEQGGRGDSSSTSGSRKINFPEYCEKNGILPNSLEQSKAKETLESKGYKLEY